MKRNANDVIAAFAHMHDEALFREIRILRVGGNHLAFIGFAAMRFQPLFKGVIWVTALLRATRAKRKNKYDELQEFHSRLRTAQLNAHMYS